jgi:hypothetical protein
MDSGIFASGQFEEINSNDVPNAYTSERDMQQQKSTEMLT